MKIEKISSDISDIKYRSIKPPPTMNGAEMKYTGIWGANLLRIPNTKLIVMAKTRKGEHTCNDSKLAFAFALTRQQQPRTICWTSGSPGSAWPTAFLIDPAL